jgi:glycosyltransferase involved in cell wall biosynthesis
MRVLLLLDSYEENDFSLVIPQLCERWVPVRQIHLSSVSFGPDGPLASSLRELGVGTQHVPAASLGDMRHLRERGRAFLYRSDRPDLLLSFCAWPALNARLFHDGNPYVPLLCALPGMPRPIEGGFLKRLIGGMVERRTRPQVRSFVVPTHRTKGALIEAGVPESQTHLIRPGVDAVQAFPLSERKKNRYRMLMGVSEDCPVLLSARSLDDPGIVDLLEAMKQVVSRVPEARLFLVGEGSSREALETRIGRLGLAAHVRIIGNLSAILTKLFSAADVYIHPYRDESFAPAVAQAQATGSPVVALKMGSMHEQVLEGETGLLVPPGDNAALAKAMVELLVDREKRQRMGSEARSFIMESYELSNTAEEYIKLWKQAAPDADWKTTTGSIPVDELREIKKESLESMKTPVPTKSTRESP